MGGQERDNDGSKMRASHSVTPYALKTSELTHKLQIHAVLPVTYTENIARHVTLNAWPKINTAPVV